MFITTPDIPETAYIMAKVSDASTTPHVKVHEQFPMVFDPLDNGQRF
jgi:hypothetical protein